MEGSSDSQRERNILEIKDAIAKEAWRNADTKILEYLKNHPNDPNVLMYLGISRAAQGFEPEGEHLLLVSLTLNPHNKDAYYHLGIIVLEQGRCILASEAFKKGLTIDSTDQALLFQLGRALERLGNRDEALEAYQKALIHTPDGKQSHTDFEALSRTSIERLQNPSIIKDMEACEE